MNEEPSVLLVVSNLEYGGAQRQIVELANALNQRGYDVHVCSLSEYVPLSALLENRNGKLHIVRKRFKFDISVIPRLSRVLRAIGADLVHSFLFDADIASRLAGRWIGTPVIVGSERNTNYHLKRRQLLAYRLTRKCVDVIIANSRSGATFNGNALGHAKSIYRVVHNGVDVNRFRPRAAHSIRAELGIASNEKVVGIFASFKPQKNHALFLAAARRVLRHVENARFLFVGDELHRGLHGSTEYKRGIDRMVDELNLRDRCIFLGNRDDVERLYCACDLTVLPSLFEGTPNSALESMACGVPVVATDVSDNAYVIPHGRAGYIVPLGDEEALEKRICSLLRDVTQRREMGWRARSWVTDEFSIHRLAEKTAAVYEEALVRKGLQRSCGRTR